MLAVMAGVGSAVLLMVRLFVPRPVGVADNYDGPRLMCHLGVDVRLPRGMPRLRDYVIVRYDHIQHFSCRQEYLGSIRLPDVPYRSSQLVLLYAGRAVTRVLGLPGYLDLRAVGLVCCVLIGAAVGLLFRFVQLRYRYRVVLCGAVLVVVADTVFIDYAVSPFSEIASIVGLLWVVVGVVMLTAPGRRVRLAGLAVVGVSGLFFATAKTQNFPGVAPLAVVVLATPLAMPTRRLGRRLGGVDRRLRYRLAGLLTVLVLGVGAVAVSGNEDRRTARMTGANFVTVTLLPTSAHPERDLAELGAPAWLADYAGAPPWCAPTALQNGAAYKQFTKKLSHKQIMRFFLNHPGRLLPVLDRVAGYFYVPRATATLCQQTPAGKRMMVTPLLANYTKIGHTPRGLLDRRWTPVTDAVESLRGSGLGTLVVLWAVPVGAVVGTRRRRGMRGVGAVVGVVVTVAVAQFVASAFADGIDTAKHLNLAVFATALGWVFAAVELVVVAFGRRKQQSGAGAGRSDTRRGAKAESEPVELGTAATEGPAA
ncbi:hypothetical protein GCM10009839_76790 [Catenulispora yoronensis]|uniref:Glycosyltransferase RgtA/B/C/D-like domain-containing protein n=1 Tax=Catenulispora yoronensis TaxID=450799 RepID=A0ABP5GW87_9ACTN